MVLLLRLAATVSLKVLCTDHEGQTAIEDRLVYQSMAQQDIVYSCEKLSVTLRMVPSWYITLDS